MPIPNNGPVSADDIQDEFGGSNPISLNEYYGAATGVPSSNQISFSNFRGKSAVVLNLSFVSRLDAYGFERSALARLDFSQFGTVETFTEGSDIYSDTTDWITPGGSNLPQYDVYVSRSSSGGTSGSFDTWVNLQTSPNFSISRSSSGTYESTFTVQVREAANTSNVSNTKSIIMSAEVETRND